jgi:excisionase family DNA binding protein
MRTRHPRSLTSPASHSTLLRSIITSLRPLVPLCIRISERRALLKRDGRSAQHRRRLCGAHACLPHHPPSSSAWRIDGHRVHRANNHATPYSGCPRSGVRTCFSSPLDRIRLDVDGCALLTVAGVAGELKVNQQTVRNWVDRRELASVRVGSRRVRVGRSTLDAFLDEGAARNDRTADVVALRDELARSLHAARAAASEDSELAAALRRLSRAAARLARTLERRD